MLPYSDARPTGETMERIRTLDLFAGAGGLTLGFEQAGLGFEPVQAVEIDLAAARTFKRNFGCPVYDGPIEKLDEFEPADVIIGGPPCQGFSPLGRDRDDVSRARLNELWEHYLRAVRQVSPAAFVIENVPEFQRSVQFAKLLQLMEEDAELQRYRYAYGVLNAADYGVPQVRRRGIFLAVRGLSRCPGRQSPRMDPCPTSRPHIGRSGRRSTASTPSPRPSAWRRTRRAGRSYTSGVARGPTRSRAIGPFLLAETGSTLLVTGLTSRLVAGRRSRPVQRMSWGGSGGTAPA